MSDVSRCMRSECMRTFVCARAHATVSVCARERRACVRACGCARACVHASVRACVRACVRERVDVRVYERVCICGHVCA